MSILEAHLKNKVWKKKCWGILEGKEAAFPSVRAVTHVGAANPAKSASLLISLGHLLCFEPNLSVTFL